MRRSEDALIKVVFIDWGATLSVMKDSTEISHSGKTKLTFMVRNFVYQQVCNPQNAFSPRQRMEELFN